jgi:hypothetical protein
MKTATVKTIEISNEIENATLFYTKRGLGQISKAPQRI